MKLEHINAIVSGAASGIGRAFSLELARAGARVHAVDLDAAGLRQLEQDAAGLPGAIDAAVLDISQEAAVRALLKTVSDGPAPANLLVNNAGILRDGWLVRLDVEGFARKLPTAQWRAVLETNLTAPYLLSREFAAARVEAGHNDPALIVNVSSVTSAGNPGQSNYAASKAGLDALTRTWALELAPFGIRVAGLAPGLTDTPMAAGLAQATRDELVAQVPLRRMAEPHEIWQGLRFIVECDYFNGRIIAIDGGATFS
ncbi:SDR family oxidoreductase [Chromobacterium vaccinii]|uniref:SDR family oxidoreductase HmlD n=1 Tax=Chromobacterium vaccinii TaxID=1108595 RepID=UPI003C719EEB